MGFICSVHWTNMCTNYQLTPDVCVLCLNRHHFFLPITMATHPRHQLQMYGLAARSNPSHSSTLYCKVVSPHCVCNYKDKIPPKMLFTPLARLSCCIIWWTCWTELQLPWAQTRDWARSISRLTHFQHHVKNGQPVHTSLDSGCRRNSLISNSRQWLLFRR